MAFVFFWFWFSAGFNEIIDADALQHMQSQEISACELRIMVCGVAEVRQTNHLLVFFCQALNFQLVLFFVPSLSWQLFRFRI